MRSNYQKLLLEENVKASRVGITFLKNFEETGCLTRRLGSGRPSKATAEIKGNCGAPNARGQQDYGSLRCILVARKYNITLRTILRCRTALGWTFCGSAYCQLIQETNKDKCLAWVQAHLHETFDNVTWTDECTIQLETHRHFCCQKQGEPPRPKLRYSTFHVGDYNVIYLYSMYM